MDFGTLLHKAQKNGQTEKKEIRYYSTKFEPPKKEQRTKTLSANIQKFLARKEEEEKRKQEDANRRRDQLLELRSKDKKAVRRVNVMMKRTKSANQSVIQDAVDNVNTAVTLAGPSQPDEDDYGYVSQSASEYYNKMMEKYNQMPDEPKFNLSPKKKVSTNLTSTKERVKAALDREAEEAMLPHRRKRKHKETDGGGGNEPDEKDKEEKYDKYEKKEEKPMKPKLKPAPVINFTDLLKIAEKKQFEPIKIEQKEKEEERLLTKRQRREMERERESRERRELREQQGLSTPVTPPQQPPKINKIPKLNGESSSKPSEPQRRSEPSKSNSENRIPKNGDFKVPKTPNGLNERVPRKQVDERSNIRPQSSTKSAVDPKAKLQKADIKKTDHRALDSRDNRGKDVKSSRPSMPPTQAKPKDYPPKDLKPRQDIKSKPDLKPKPKQFPPNDLRPKQFPPNDLKPKQFPPNDLKPKQFPPRDLKPKQFPPPDMRRPAKRPLVSKGKIFDDDDEEYDSEMDDFIDDGPEEEEDYSKYISEIFGYDKKKYRSIDDDCDDMETSFAAQMREEVISTKIGIMEDLEDMKQEEEAKRRKAMLKKKQRR